MSGEALQAQEIRLGLIAVIATPTARVIASLVGYVRGGERRMAVVSVAILTVIAASVAVSAALPGAGPGA